MGCQSSQPISIPKQVKQLQKTAVTNEERIKIFRRTEASPPAKDLPDRNLNHKEETRVTLNDCKVDLNYSFDSHSGGRISYSSNSESDLEMEEDEKGSSYSALECQMRKIAKKKQSNRIRILRVKGVRTCRGKRRGEYHSEESLYTKFFKIKKNISRHS